MRSEATPTKHEMRRMRTRKKIMEAGRRLMGEKGIGNVSIAEITELAGVGFGSFYNHFVSQEQLAEAIFIELTDRLGQFADSIARETADKALALAFIGRAYIVLAEKDPVWAWFAIRVDAFFPQLDSILVNRARLHVASGMKNGRFAVHNAGVAVALSLASFHEIARMTIGGKYSKKDCVFALELVLRMYGISSDEASKLVRKRWPQSLKAQFEGDMSIIALE